MSIIVHSFFLLLVILSDFVGTAEDEFGWDVITQMREDANLDLPRDEEYEDLRAELLAYHTMLAKLSSSVVKNATSVSGRRSSLKIVPCAVLGGICIHFKLCEGSRYLTEVRGCRDNLQVCCFVWNRFRPRDMREFGIANPLLPWGSPRQEYGVGRGVIDRHIFKKKKVSVTPSPAVEVIAHHAVENKPLITGDEDVHDDAADSDDPGSDEKPLLKQRIPNFLAERI